MKPRGGMSKNAFGQRERLDKLDLFRFAASEDSPEKLVYLAIIQDAVHNYLFFGLGRNGTTAQEFIWSCEYLFRVRSWDTASWQDQRTMKTITRGVGQRRVQTQELSDDQLRNMCFDVHYELSGMANYMPLETFVPWLIRERRAVITENMQQVQDYLKAIRGSRAEKFVVGQQTRLTLDLENLLQLLTIPGSQQEFAELLYGQTQSGGTPLEAGDHNSSHRARRRSDRRSTHPLPG